MVWNSLALTSVPAAVAMVSTETSVMVRVLNQLSFGSFGALHETNPMVLRTRASSTARTLCCKMMIMMDTKGEVVVV